MSLYDQIRAEVDGVVAGVKAKLLAAKADGELTAGELWSLAMDGLTSVLGVAIRLLQILPASGPEKRAAAIEAAVEFYKAVIKPLNIPYLPDFIVEPMVDDAIERALPAIVGGMIDALHRMLKPNLPPAPPAA